ncbi:MAG: hypothetical protein EA339_06710 [Rhodobacteraceae bacterium]|nr:MAG: hypothetical protein EA339_06710 [Paracoccaceae bacterium]
MADIPNPERAAVHQALLRRAGIRGLTDSSTSELHDMNRDLASACETARRAAIERILHPALENGKDHLTDANFGFAGLFAALRRVRAELDRRKAKPSQRPLMTRIKRDQIAQKHQIGVQR